MKTITAALKTFLASNNVGCAADLITLTLSGGGVYRWTSGDMDLTTSDSRTFSHLGQLISIGRSRQMDDLTVDSFELTVQLAGVPTLLQEAVAGLLDGATVTRELQIMPTWGNTSLGVPLIMWSGFVSQVEPTSTEVLLRCKSDLERLNVPFPRRLFQPQCPYQLGDAGCGITLATYTTTTTANTGSTATAIVSVAAVTSAKILGWLSFTSGANSGLVRMVQSVTGSTLTVSIPFPVAPAVGDAFTVTDGCDKTQATCGTHFSNLGRFGGFPLLPRPDTTL